MTNQEFIAVKTTGIFCREGCPAKPPLSKNVVKFKSFEEVASEGYRPCKVCTPQYPFLSAVVEQSRRSMTLRTPNYFSFDQLVSFLSKYSEELLYKITDQSIYRLYCAGTEGVLVSIQRERRNLRINFLNRTVKKAKRLAIANHIWKWFDLSRDVTPFYLMAKNDAILSKLTKRYRGLRLIRIPNLFESICWAIIGQQVNLSFAFKVKAAFVKKYGASERYEGTSFYSFPEPDKIADLSISELKRLKLSQGKAEYIKEVARQCSSEELSVNDLERLSYSDAYECLLAIRGIGPWTADYVLMKTFGHSQAFPVADVGLQNAVKKVMGLKTKPSKEKLRKLARNWKGWEAYATFYLWRHLYG